MEENKKQESVGKKAKMIKRLVLPSSISVALALVGALLWNTPSFLPSERTTDSFALVVKSKIEQSYLKDYSTAEVRTMYAGLNKKYMPLIYTDDTVSLINSIKNKITIKVDKIEGLTSGDKRIFFVVSLPVSKTLKEGNLKRLDLLKKIQAGEINSIFNKETIGVSPTSIYVDIYSCGFAKWCLRDSGLNKNAVMSLYSEPYSSINQATRNFDETVYKTEDIKSEYMLYGLEDLNINFKKEADSINNDNKTIEDIKNHAFEMAKKVWKGIPDLLKRGVSIDESLVEYRTIMMQRGEYSSIDFLSISDSNSLYELAKGNISRDYSEFKDYYVQHDYNKSPAYRAWAEEMASGFDCLFNPRCGSNSSNYSYDYGYGGYGW